ncbi:MAG: VWA domain-containing protein [Bacteroidota bacterium]
MTIKIVSLTLLAAFMSLESCSDSGKTQNPEPKPIFQTSGKSNNKIQVALLLDTSSSMDGLIDQAKARLWDIVNTLTTLKYQGKTPTIEIALYEYGNENLSPDSNYIRQVSTLTTDLDLISEKLFSLTTYGGDEYCGAVISEATKKMDWGSNESDMKLIYIAGNEEFDQGGTAYSEAIQEARKHNIYINTIFCGDRSEATSNLWKSAADKGSGKFFNINADEQIAYIETPYDSQIWKCNERMNGTYVQYGKIGEQKKQNQVLQDANASSVSYAAATERTVSKSKGVYKNESWDLVDKVKEDKNALKTIQKEELPAQLQGKSAKDIEKYVSQKTKERKEIQQKIGALNIKRQEYIEKEQRKNGKQNDLGAAIKRSVIELAKAKGYTVEQ